MVRNILVDTSAIFAIVSPGDRFHTQARDIYLELLERGDQLYTTSYVLVESSALIHRRLGFEPLRTFSSQSGEHGKPYGLSEAPMRKSGTV